MKRKVCIITLGCPKNITDSEYIMASLPKDKYILTDSPIESDLILLNTCGFIADSIKESESYIKSLSDLKKKYSYLTIIVFGCMVSRLGVDGLAKKYPLIDGFYPVLSSDTLLKYLNVKFNYLRQQLITPAHYTYLKISDGCNRGCAYCTIPCIKGKYVSVDYDRLLKEAENLVNNGVKEIILTGQETTNYGQDLKKGNDFISLVDDISKIRELKWLRILYTHPLSFDSRLLELIESRYNICNYIDMPLQHISDNILNSMKRGTSSRQIKDIIKQIRSASSKIAIRSTFIVGYPGETKEDFETLYNFLEEYQLDRIGVFKYSKEPKTIAASLEHQVPEKKKQMRFDKLMQLQQSISLNNNKKYLNKTLKVLIDEEQIIDGKKYFIARTEYDCPDIDNSVIIDADSNKCKNDNKNEFIIGGMPEVLIKDVAEYDLYA